jgi:hypothetical protein
MRVGGDYQVNTARQRLGAKGTGWNARHAKRQRRRPQLVRPVAARIEQRAARPGYFVPEVSAQAEYRRPKRSLAGYEYSHFSPRSP